MKASRWLEGDRLRPGVIVLSLGGNIGGEDQLCARMRQTVVTLEESWGTGESSDFYRSAPMGAVTEQADFVNAVAAFRPDPVISPEEALFALQALELAAGRIRALPGGPRSLDLDLLLVGAECRTHEALMLPHPRMHQRAFVLAPLRELFGEGLRWQDGGPLGDALRSLDPQRIERIEV